MKENKGEQPASILVKALEEIRDKPMFNAHTYQMEIKSIATNALSLYSQSKGGEGRFKNWLEERIKNYEGEKEFYGKKERIQARLSMLNEVLENYNRWQSPENEGKQAGVEGAAKEYTGKQSAWGIINTQDGEGEIHDKLIIQKEIFNAFIAGAKWQPSIDSIRVKESGERIKLLGEVERLKGELEIAKIEIQRLTYLIHEK
jgi:hypothetical protein